MMTPAPTSFDVWVAALDSGYVRHRDFVEWADRRIEAEPHQPRWVLDLSLSRDAEEAVGVLRGEWSRRSELQTGDLPPMREPARLHLGFLYLAYETGQLSMEKLLWLSGRYADGNGAGDVPECETFYCLLNELEGKRRTSDRPLTDRVADLFAPMASAARCALRDLPCGPAAT